MKYPPVSSKMLESQIGYIRPEGFPSGRTQEIAARIRDLQKNGAKRLILDLRNSGDGEMAEGVSTANLFLDHGRSPTWKDRSIRARILRPIPRRQLPACPWW